MFDFSWIQNLPVQPAYFATATILASTIIPFFAFLGFYGIKKRGN